MIALSVNGEKHEAVVILYKALPDDLLQRLAKAFHRSPGGNSAHKLSIKMQQFLQKLKVYWV